MFIDEFYYHYKRGLPFWEAIGHPADTLCFFACFLFLCNYAPNLDNLYIYLGLATLSCLIITKDEFIHSKICCSGEMWLHSVLFILHPLTLISAGVLWWYAKDLEARSAVDWILSTQCYIVGFYMGYQILYWSIPWKKQVPVAKAPETCPEPKAKDLHIK